MFFSLLTVFIFALAYALKGGSGNFLKNWNEVRNRNAFLNRIMDGRVIGTILVFVFALVAFGDYQYHDALKGLPVYSINLISSSLFAAAWLVGVAPSMGEEHGAVGRIGRAWGPYLAWMPQIKHFDLMGLRLFSYTEGREYGIKKAVQRGIFIGAAMALATGYVPYICFSLLFVPCVFIGQELSFRILKRDGWVISEPIIGAVVYGIPTAMMINAM